MLKKDFNIILSRLQATDETKFKRLYADHHEADLAWIRFCRSPAEFYLTSGPQMQENLWGLSRP